MPAALGTSVPAATAPPLEARTKGQPADRDRNHPAATGEMKGHCASPSDVEGLPPARYQLGGFARHHGGAEPAHQMHLRQRTDGYVKDTLLHSTIREMQALLFSPRFWGALLAVSAILGLTGPFGTYQELELLPRSSPATWPGG